MSWLDDAAGANFLAAKVARVHGPTHPAMVELSAIVAELSAGRDAAGSRARLEQLTDGFAPWPGACASVHRLYADLRALAGQLPAEA
jgi:iron-sulfur cluster repair protein YtfE (RIC family)